MSVYLHVTICVWGSLMPVTCTNCLYQRGLWAWPQESSAASSIVQAYTEVSTSSFCHFQLSAPLIPDCSPIAGCWFPVSWQHKNPCKLFLLLCVQRPHLLLSLIKRSQIKREIRRGQWERFIWPHCQFMPCQIDHETMTIRLKSSETVSRSDSNLLPFLIAQ